MRSVDYRMDELSLEEVEAERALYGPFTESLRDLVDAAIRTSAPEDEIRRAHAEIAAVTERLRSAPMRTTYGVDLRTDGRGRAWGNAVVGLRNAIAPPLTIVTEGRGVRSSFDLGAAYEGPPGCVHGGVLALVLDQMLGEAAGAGGKPGMTATLTLSYRQRTLLGELTSEAWIERSDGIKTWARGEIHGPDGLTVEAEGLFILPRWAREGAATGDPGTTSPQFFE
jgi:acyl-coenzyme A thioesterase PaaI-like protein